jgi:hypothetical protein
MHGMFWGERKVGEWTDREWERLRAIKRGEFVPTVEENSDYIGAQIPTWLKCELKKYAKAKGLSIADIIRQAMYILTS